MAIRATMNQELLAIIQTMEQEGLVDHRLRYARSLKEANGPFFFVELIPTYCTDAVITINEFTKALEHPAPDFHQLGELCFKFKGGTSCLGAQRVALACSEFRHAVDENSKDGCIMALNSIKHEFSTLQEKLDAIIELESKILSHASEDP